MCSDNKMLFLTSHAGFIDIADRVTAYGIDVYIRVKIGSPSVVPRLDALIQIRLVTILPISVLYLLILVKFFCKCANISPRSKTFFSVK